MAYLGFPSNNKLKALASAALGSAASIFRINPSDTSATYLQKYFIWKFIFWGDMNLLYSLQGENSNI